MIVIGSMWLHAQPGFGWQGVLEAAVRSADSTSQLRLETSGDALNLLVLHYLASRHDEIAAGTALEQALQQCALRPDGKILLIACDLTDPDVSMEEIIDLLSNKLPSMGMRATAERAADTESYGTILDLFLQQQLRIALPSYGGFGKSPTLQDSVADPNEDWDF